MGCCFSMCIPEVKLDLPSQNLPDEIYQSLQKQQFVLTWKQNIYDAIEQNTFLAKYWQAQKIAKHKHLVSKVVQQALTLTNKNNKSWTQLQLNTLLRIKQNQLETNSQGNEMVNQNDIYLSTQIYNGLHIKQKLAGTHKNNQQKIIDGVLETAKILL